MPTQKRVASDIDIVITGAGVVAPVGVGLADYIDGLAAGRDAFGVMEGGETATGHASDRLHAPDPTLDANASPPVPAFTITGFDPHKLLPGVKGLRSMSRTAHFACAAAELALADARLPRGDAAGHTIGLVGGTVYGNVGSVGRFVREVETEGPRFVDAMLFPNTVLNSAAGFASIAFNLTALNSTVNAGPATGIAALGYAVRLLRRGRAQSILAGAYEELSPWLHLGFQAEGLLAPAQGRANGRPLPYGRDRQGTVLGEGAALLCLETRAAAAARGVRASTVVAGLAEGYAAGDLARTYAGVIRRALASARVDARELGAAIVSASGDRDLDLIEARALGDALGAEALARMPLVPLKAAIGETSGAHGALAAAAAHGLLAAGRSCRLPVYPLDPAVGFMSLDGSGKMGSVPITGPVLVTCAGHSRSVAALIIDHA